MPFNYQKRHDDHGNFWASYSDLLLGMGVVFLLLYVTASLTAGTSGMHSHLENQKLTKEIQDLRNQLKAYESVKDDYINKSASEVEKEQYMELLDKLTLLEEETKLEEDKLKKALKEQGKKQKALNQYQQMIRNIINANTLAKTKIAKREEVIETQDIEIEQQKDRINALNDQIQENLRERQMIAKELEDKSNRLKQAYLQNKITEEQYQKTLDHIKEKNKEELSRLENAAKDLQGKLAQAQEELKNMNEELGATKKLAKNLGSELDKSKEELGKAKAALGEKESKISSLKGQLGDAEKNIKRLQEELNARKKAADDIRKAFAKKGIKAEVLGNGDVIIDFGEHHFDNDSASLKKEMKEIIKRAIPVYAQSIFENKQISDKITSIEIVGFASPTYKGRFINPNSSLKQDKEALAYNMDLSYRRAKSIYEYTFHDPDSKFSYQDKMLPLVKVSARGFLEMFEEKRRPSNFEQYCKVNDCNKARRVMIKFNIDTNR